MEIIPAIYILDGKCVALYKGNYDQKEIYYESPVRIARNFKKEGAQKLYVADLNGKMTQSLVQKDKVKEIIDAVDIPIQLEAGFNTLEDIQEALDLGVLQVILRSPPMDFVEKAISKFGAEKIIIQIFSKRQEVIDNHKKLRPDDYTDVVEYAEKLVPLGVKYVIYKDQRSEGTLIHPNYDEIDRLFLVTGNNLKIYSSGGISEKNHLKLLKKIGASGAIIGKAFYENIISIKEAQEAVAD